MSIQSIKRHEQWLVAAGVVLVLAGVFVARTAFAKVIMNTVDPVGILAQDGRHVMLTGPIAITAGERVEMRVTVTQRTTGAVAEGHAVLVGTGTTVGYHILPYIEGDERFEVGPATVVAMVRTSVRGQATDAHQWLVNVALVKE